MTVYHDKIETDPLLQQILLAIGIPPDAKFHKLYTKTWTNATLTFLQHPKIYKLLLKKKKTRKSILTLFYKMTINNGTKKIEVPPKGIPCTCYVASSLGRMFIVVRFLFLCARDFSVQ